jgi:hypothetical protein
MEISQLLVCLGRLVLGEDIVVLAHEVEVILGHQAGILHAVEVVENELRFLTVETVGMECRCVDLDAQAFALAGFGRGVDPTESLLYSSRLTCYLRASTPRLSCDECPPLSDQLLRCNAE